MAASRLWPGGHRVGAYGGVGRAARLLPSMERMQRGRQDVPGVSRSRPGPFHCVGDVEILIASSVSSVADPVSTGAAVGDVVTWCRGSRWQLVACRRAVDMLERVAARSRRCSAWPVVDGADAVRAAGRWQAHPVAALVGSKKSGNTAGDSAAVTE